MKYLDKFRDAAIGKALLKKLHEATRQPITIMEVCGTHTMAIFRSGIRDLFPKNLCLVSGPGCPVCVTPQGYIDEVLKLSQRPDIIIATFGDLMRVPGTTSSLLQEKEIGKDVRVVYSPLDAVDMAAANPQKQVVFLGVGFETTAPIIALTVLEAARRKIDNYSVFSANKLVPPAMAALVTDEEIKIDGFLCPGHVSAIIGTAPYRFLSEDYGIPAVIAGFEANDILQGLLTLVELVQERRPAVLNNYARVVAETGNPQALAVMEKVFSPIASQWRGIGIIDGSGLALRPEYAPFDTRRIFAIDPIDSDIPSGCSCGDILKGKKTPPDCSLYKTACRPENPVGACMVSTEGTCAAYYRFGHD